MKYRISSLAVLVLLLPLITQCAPVQDVNNLALRMRNINSRVGKIDKTVDKLSNPQRLDRVQSKQAAISNTIDNLNADILQIKGRLEENRHNYQIMRADNKRLKADIKTKFTNLADQIALLTDQLNQTNEHLTAVKQAGQDTIDTAKAAADAAQTSLAKAELALTQARSAAARAASAREIALKAEKRVRTSHKSATKPLHQIVPRQKKMTPAAPKKAAAAAKVRRYNKGHKLYDQALHLFRKRKFTKSYRTFSHYLSKYPKGKLAPNAQFWMGDCYYSQHEYELAILEYQKVIAHFPKNAKAPAALLKQGLAFERLKDNDTAKIVYRKLLTKYPRSEQTKTAKKRIATLK